MNGGIREKLPYGPNMGVPECWGRVMVAAPSKRG